MSADCPRCGVSKMAKAKSFHLGSWTCNSCAKKSRRADWTNAAEVDTDAVYIRSVADLLFLWEGRVSRCEFLSIFTVGITLSSLLYFINPQVAGAFCVCFCLFIVLPTGIKRVQDTGRSTQTGCLSFLLGGGLLFLLCFLVFDMFRKGSPTANRYGPPPCRIFHSRRKALLTIRRKRRLREA